MESPQEESLLVENVPDTIDSEEIRPEEEEYTFSFIIQKLTLPDAKYDDVTVSLTFSDNVLNIQPKKEEATGKKGAVKKAPVKKAGKGTEVTGPVEEEPFLKGLEMTMHFTPEKLAATLKLNPIMFHLARGEESLGEKLFNFLEDFYLY